MAVNGMGRFFAIEFNMLFPQRAAVFAIDANQAAATALSTGAADKNSASDDDGCRIARARQLGVPFGILGGGPSERITCIAGIPICRGAAPRGPVVGPEWGNC